MKKTTLLILLLSIFSFGELVAQTDYYTCLPTDGSVSANARAPHGRYRYQRGVVLIKATEMTTSGIVNADVINSIAFKYLVAQDVITNGTMTLYLQNTADLTNLKSTTWATAITGMTTVSAGAVTVPNTVGNAIFNFSGGSPFTYTGGGVYVAFDYQNATNPLPTTFASIDCNSTGLTGGFKGAQSDTAIPTAITVSNFRPVILLGKLVTCARPNNIVENIALKTTTSITGSWNSTSTTSIEYGIYGFTPGTGTTVVGVTSPYTISGLTPSTVYDVYLRNNCGTTGSPIYSAVTDVESFNTVFLPADPNYSTSFEQENFPFIGWSLVTGTPVGSDWQLGFFGPPSMTNTLTQDGNSSIYSLSGITTTPANNWLISRGVNLTVGSTVTVTFYTRNYQAASSTGTSSYNITVGTGQNVAAQTTVIGTEVNNAAITWVQKTYNYTAPSTGVYYFGIQNVSAANAIGQQALFVDNFVVTQTLSTTDFINSKLSVYPNPAKDMITISNDVNAVVSIIEITDLNGRIVKTKSLDATQGQISTSDLATGVYMMKIVTDQGTATKKIIKE